MRQNQQNLNARLAKRKPLQLKQVALTQSPPPPPPITPQVIVAQTKVRQKYKWLMSIPYLANPKRKAGGHAKLAATIPPVLKIGISGAIAPIGSAERRLRPCLRLILRRIAAWPDGLPHHQNQALAWLQYKAH